jgi:hypothetical protein
VNELRWRKSSYTSANGDCVELAHTLELVRDTKNRTGPTLHADIEALVHAAKTGQLDR